MAAKKPAAEPAQSGYVPPFTDGVDTPVPDPVEPVEPVTESGFTGPVEVVDPIPPVFLPSMEPQPDRELPPEPEPPPEQE